MYNTDIPDRSDLPTPRQLHRSSFLAICVGAALYVFTYLPAEYGVDPTGIGRLLGLTEMGEIKMQLLKEAHPERHSGTLPTATTAAARQA